MTVTAVDASENIDNDMRQVANHILGVDLLFGKGVYIAERGSVQCSAEKLKNNNNRKAIYILLLATYV